MAIIIVKFTSPFVSLNGSSSFGKKFVGVVCDVFIEDLHIGVHILVKWPISQALYEGISLYNHGRQNHICVAANLKTHGGL